MADPLSEERLALVLTSVGDHLVVPEVPAGDVMWSARPPRRGRSVAAAAVAVALAGAALGAAPVRDAVADWFGLGSTGFERVSPEEADPRGLPPLEAGLTTVSRDEAAARLGRPLPSLDDAGLGEPDRIALPPEGGVLLAWDRGATTLWVRPHSDPPDVVVDKLLDDFDAVERVPNLGEAAVYVDGDHVLVTPHRQVAAGTVVLWIEAGLELRLASDSGLEEMLATAREVHIVTDATGVLPRSPGS